MATTDRRGVSATPAGMHTMEHAATVRAPAEVVYRLVADVTRWPLLFRPTVHTEHLSRGQREERFSLWAMVGGEVLNWTSRRTLDPQALRVTFQQEHSRPPFAGMGGAWEFRALSGGSTEVVLTHWFRTAEDTPAAADAARKAVDHNSTAELAALRRVAELDASGTGPDELMMEFDDTVAAAGPTVAAYAFVHEADRWAERLPHVERVTLDEDTRGVQRLEMRTLAADGSTHDTSSIRLCSPGVRIVYKQTAPPALLLGHSGRWTFEPDGTGCRITSRHAVLLDPDEVARRFGVDGLAEARAFVRKALGGNSRTTLEAAGAFAAAG